MKFVIFASTESQFRECADKLEKLGCARSDIVFAESAHTSRRRVINQHLSEWMVFLDHDCSISADALAHLRRLSNGPASGMQVVAGHYVDPSPVNLIQRTHNFIANHWMRQSYTEGVAHQLFLGGAFMIHADRELTESGDLFWGAEDKQLAYQLHDLGCVFRYDEKFAVIHNTSRSIGHFLRRAYLHGKNDVLKLRVNHNPINFSYWRKNTDFSDVSLVALVLLHFFVQKAATAIQKVRLLNK